MNKRAATGLLVVAVIVIVGGIAAIAMKPKAKQANSSTTTTSTSATDKTSATKEASQSNTVTIQDFAYSPAAITVKVGTTVTWTNQDSVGHTVTVTSGTGPDSQLFGKGETYSYTFKKAGTFDYFCKPHPYMKGSVTVTE